MQLSDAIPPYNVVLRRTSADMFTPVVPDGENVGRKGAPADTHEYVRLDGSKKVYDRADEFHDAQRLGGHKGRIGGIPQLVVTVVAVAAAI